MFDSFRNVYFNSFREEFSDEIKQKWIIGNPAMAAVI